MIYLITLYLLQFFTVGAMFSAILIFYEQFFELMFVEHGNQWLEDFYKSGLPSEIFFALYIFGLLLCVFIGIALPVDRSMPYYGSVSLFFAILILSTIGGIIYFLAQTGFYPPEMKLNEETDEWEETGEHYFSWLTLAGIIMLSVYTLPFLLRPLDFAQNAKHYIAGLISYIFLLPMFLNVFQIYSMCNLHDISWGNRPADTTGAETFTANKKTQEKIKGDYMVFRTNFVFFWMILNGFYVVFILLLVNGTGHRTTRNDGSFGYLEIFSLYLAGLVVFRVVFAILYIIGWKWAYCCFKRYKIQHHDLKAEHKRIVERTNADGDSTDDETFEDQVNDIFKKKEKQIVESHRRRSSVRAMSLTGGMSVKQSAEEPFNAQKETVRHLVEESEENPEDSDDDFREFQVAEVEEAEDRIYAAYKNNKMQTS